MSVPTPSSIAAAASRGSTARNDSFGVPASTGTRTVTHTVASTTATSSDHRGDTNAYGATSPATPELYTSYPCCSRRTDSYGNVYDSSHPLSHLHPHSDPAHHSASHSAGHSVTHHDDNVGYYRRLAQLLRTRIPALPSKTRYVYEQPYLPGGVPAPPQPLAYPHIERFFNGDAVKTPVGDDAQAHGDVLIQGVGCAAATAGPRSKNPITPSNSSAHPDSHSSVTATAAAVAPAAYSRTQPSAAARALRFAGTWATVALTGALARRLGAVMLDDVALDGCEPTVAAAVSASVAVKAAAEDGATATASNSKNASDVASAAANNGTISISNHLAASLAAIAATSFTNTHASTDSNSSASYSFRHTYGATGAERTDGIEPTAAPATTITPTHASFPSFEAAAVSRAPAVPLLTVTNHTSTLDDPTLSCLMAPAAMLSPRTMRWVPCGEDICFASPLPSALFYLGRALPLRRGAGLQQSALGPLADRLRAGEWVHIFPEGRVVYAPRTSGGESEPLLASPSTSINARGHFEADVGPPSVSFMRWGVGKLAADAALPAVLAQVDRELGDRGLCDTATPATTTTAAAATAVRAEPAREALDSLPQPPALLPFTHDSMAHLVPPSRTLLRALIDGAHSHSHSDGGAMSTVPSTGSGSDAGSAQGRPRSPMTIRAGPPVPYLDLVRAYALELRAWQSGRSLTEPPAVEWLYSKIAARTQAALSELYGRGRYSDSDGDGASYSHNPTRSDAHSGNSHLGRAGGVEVTTNSAGLKMVISKPFDSQRGDDENRVQVSGDVSAHLDGRVSVEEACRGVPGWWYANTLYQQQQLQLQQQQQHQLHAQPPSQPPSQSQSQSQSHHPALRLLSPSAVRGYGYTALAAWERLSPAQQQQAHRDYLRAASASAPASSALTAASAAAAVPSRPAAAGRPRSVVYDRQRAHSAVAHGSVAHGAEVRPRHDRSEFARDAFAPWRWDACAASALLGSHVAKVKPGVGLEEIKSALQGLMMQEDAKEQRNK